METLVHQPDGKLVFKEPILGSGCRNTVCKRRAISEREPVPCTNGTGLCQCYWCIRETDEENNLVVNEEL